MTGAVKFAPVFLTSRRVLHRDCNVSQTLGTKELLLIHPHVLDLHAFATQYAFGKDLPKAGVIREVWTRFSQFQ